MRRRVRLTRLAVLTAIAAGPVALGLAVWAGPAIVAAAPFVKPATVRTAVAAADPAGYAQMFTGAWLRSTDDPTSAQARLAQSLAPDVDLPGPAADAHVAPQAVTAVRSAQHIAGVWVVTVAAQYADGRLRYFAVPVTADTSDASFIMPGASRYVLGNRISDPQATVAEHLLVGTLARHVPMGAAVLEDLEEQDPTTDSWVPLAGGGSRPWNEP
jgi:hypothetical protein